MQPDDPMQRYQALIEEILADLGVNPAQTRQRAEDQSVQYSWSLKFGSANIFMDLLVEDGEGFLRLDSPILYLPPVENREDFFSWILQLNHNLAEAAFSISGKEVHIVSTRPLEGLDADEARSILTRICGYADDLDNALNMEFGAPLWRPPAE
jgi:hypothetical protein